MPLTPTSRLLLVKPDPNPITGDFVDVTDINDNSDKIDAAISATVCTASTRPAGADAWDGRIIRETDTRRVLVYNAVQAVWDPVNGPFLCASGSRPASPFTNMMIRETDTRRVYIWNATEAVWDLVADPAGNRVARKTAEPTNLTATFLQDADLRFAIGATQLGRYVFEGHIMWRSSTTGDFKCRFSYSGSSSFRWSSDGPSAGDVSKPEFGMVFDNATHILGGTGAFTRMRVHGQANFTTTGNFIFEWAQNTLDAAGNTFVMLDSHLKMERYA